LQQQCITAFLFCLCAAPPCTILTVYRHATISSGDNHLLSHLFLVTQSPLQLARVAHENEAREAERWLRHQHLFLLDIIIRRPSIFNRASVLLYFFLHSTHIIIQLCYVMFGVLTNFRLQHIQCQSVYRTSVYKIIIMSIQALALLYSTLPIPLFAFFLESLLSYC
jgi:hypothetical protein